LASAGVSVRSPFLPFTRSLKFVRDGGLELFAQIMKSHVPRTLAVHANDLVAGHEANAGAGTCGRDVADLDSTVLWAPNPQVGTIEGFALPGQ
jgi:hypothetical protein